MPARNIYIRSHMFDDHGSENIHTAWQAMKECSLTGVYDRHDSRVNAIGWREGERDRGRDTERHRETTCSCHIATV